MRLLVTGISGFLGRALLSKLLNLAEYEDIHVVSFKSEPQIDNLNNQRVKYYKVDLTDLSAIQNLIQIAKPTHLIHLAWDISGGYQLSLQNLKWVSSSVALYEAFLRGGGQRAIFAGSCFEYDLRFGVCQEFFTPPSYVSLYSAAKNAVRELTTCLAEKANSKLVWARIFYVYGPHENLTRLVPSIIQQLIKGETIEFNTGLQLRDYLYVDDVANALIAILNSSVTGIINVGSGSVVRLKEIIKMLAAKYPNSKVEFGAMANKLEPPIVLANVNRLFKEVGFKPAIDLEEGLELTNRWWLEQNNKREL